ncbi:MAG: type II toxin-antitoxin system VapC family toxin [Solirubrobacteraceae bacterium]|nr:type II toxin-antitoxin system VapC family toxin [Solirubrobacteraceae bacterium]
MRLLLDTHAALWWLTDDARLSRTVIDHLRDGSNQSLLSAAAVWEVAIKRSLGKLDAPDGFASQLLEGGMLPLAVSLQHAEAVGDLPRHHGDPFDRLLVAQAIVEGATLVSADEALAAYDVAILW